MKTKTSWVFLAAFLAGAFSFPVHSLSVENIDGPVVEVVGTNSVELGKITCEDLKLIKFTLRNTSNSAIEIKQVTSTCPCIRGYPQQAVIPPLGEQTVTAELNPLKVKGSFKRGIWVHTTDPKQLRILLSVTGEVMPFFNGLPDSVTFRLGEPGQAWTNTFFLTATTNTLSLGKSFVAETKDMRVEATTTNLPAAGTYELRVVAVPLVESFSSARVEIPIFASATNRLPNLELRLTGRVGTQLVVAPWHFLVFPTDKPITRGFTVRTGEKFIELDKVTFSPQREGFSYDVQPSNRNTAHFVVRVTVTPEAVKKLLEEKNPKLLIGYPNYKPVDLPIISDPATAK